MKNVITILALTCATGMASASLSNFYVAGADGSIYSVNGSTLAASYAFSITEGMNINEIHFTDSSTMLANMTDSLIEYDLSTSTETVVWEASDHYTSQYETWFSSGLAGTSGGEVFMSVYQFSLTGSGMVGATFDPATATYTQGSGLSTSVSSLYFDHHQISSTVMLGADYQSETITVFNPTTGVESAVYSLDFGPVSFLELGSDLFLLDRDGDLYDFDAGTGTATYYDSLSGFTGDLVGASGVPFSARGIPAPGASLMLGLAGLVATRRRR